MSTILPSDPVLVTDQGAVRVITIARPEARNAVDAAVARGLGKAVEDLDEDPAARIGVLTGAGGTFCAGFDL
jgi:enoyl-CoA hydratase